MPQTVPVPDYVSEAARRGLEWHREGKSGEGVKDQTIREARDMVEGSISEDKVRRMGPWFRRHRPDMDAPANKPSSKDFPGAGAVAWALWGGPTSGDIMRAAEWAERTVERLDAEKNALAGCHLPQNQMTIEEQLHEALAASVALAVERDDLRATVEKLTVGAADELTAAKADIAAKDARLGELTVAVDGLSAEVVALKAALAALEADKVSASKEAAKIAASVGVAPVQMSPADNAKAEPEAVDHVAAFLALPVGSKERAEYFVAHKSAIVRGIF